MDYFTSDTHYGHKNIIKYAKRPYQTPDEMDQALIDNWNRVVTPSDRVFHLGDFAWHTPERATEIAKALQGQKFLVWGNHDKKFRNHPEFLAQFQWVKDLAEIHSHGQSIVLCHYAMRVWNQSHHGSWHLYGHSHGSLADEETSLSLDVGVDPQKYFPISFTQVKDRMALKHFVPIDRHGR